MPSVFSRKGLKDWKWIESANERPGGDVHAIMRAVNSYDDLLRIAYWVSQEGSAGQKAPPAKLLELASILLAVAPENVS